MADLKTAVQQALAKLEKLRVTIDSEWGQCRELEEIEIDGDQWQEVIDLRTALAEHSAQKRPPNCGTGYCSCIECVMEPESPAEQQEPPIHAELHCVCGAEWQWMNRTWELVVAAPQPRREVELTDEEKHILAAKYDVGVDVVSAIAAYKAKQGETK